ncbi:hypothetical protein [Lacunimicrobium album]
MSHSKYYEPNVKQVTITLALTDASLASTNLEMSGSFDTPLQSTVKFAS